MEDDYIDDDDTIWIWRLLARPVYPAQDPRHLPLEMRDRIIAYRLAQMKTEAARNVAALRATERGSQEK